MLEPLKQKLEHYQRHISSIGLIGGFVLDNLTLRRIDLLFENLVFLTYIGICAISIIFLSFAENERWQGKWPEKWRTPFLLLLQFAFGGLFSGFFIFYSRSGTISASWPFLLALLGLLIGNEVLKKRYLVMTFRVSVFFAVLFSFFIFYIPVIAREVSPQMFLLSGGVSLVLIILFINLLSTIVRDKMRSSIRAVGISIASIYLAINIMYFTNILPPIPLSMKASGVYHEVHRVGADYLGLEEVSVERFDFLRVYKKIHVRPGAPVFVYSSVFAPTDIQTTIVHEWQFKDVEGDWVTASKIPFPITGGRDGGYRGYSYKNHTTPGKWRVNIENDRGQMIGRVKIEIIQVDVDPTVVQKTL